jgi:hypothetical protein
VPRPSRPNISRSARFLQRILRQSGQLGEQSSTKGDLGLAGHRSPDGWLSVGLSGGLRVEDRGRRHRRVERDGIDRDVEDWG